MSDLVEVEKFTPTKIKSGERIRVHLKYTADEAGFIVVNEGPNFDAVPGKVAVDAGEGLRTSASIIITRQPASSSKECLVTFTLGASSYTILVGVK